MVPINCFSMLQKKNLIYADVSHKYQQILERIEKLQENDGRSFKENTIPFLTISQDRMKLAPRTRNTRLLSEEEELQEFIDYLKKDIKEPFLRDVLIELKSGVAADDPFFLAHSVFNVSARHTQEEQLQMVKILIMFHSFRQSSTFEGRKILQGL